MKCDNARVADESGSFESNDGGILKIISIKTVSTLS
jgi:hypothetical protein